MNARRPTIGTANEAALEREARIAQETRPLRHALRQTERYTDLRAHHHPLAAMSAAEALLVLALLERHAETLHRGELAEHLVNAIIGAPSDASRHGAIEAGRQEASLDAPEWLRQTPLHRALTQRASQ
jgi:hypothetical protein